MTPAKICIGFKPLKRDEKFPFRRLNCDQVVPASKEDWDYCVRHPELYEPVYLNPQYVA